MKKAKYGDTGKGCLDPDMQDVLPGDAMLCTRGDVMATQMTEEEF
jgi:hypothetical protein